MATHEHHQTTHTSSEDERAREEAQERLVTRLNFIAYIALMVIFYGIFVIYAVIPGIQLWLACM